MGEMRAAALISSAIGAGSSAYQADRQKRLAEDAKQKAEEERIRQENEAKRIALATRPEQIAATGIQFGVSEADSSTSDFLVKKKTTMKGAGVGTVGTSGLGYV